MSVTEDQLQVWGNPISKTENDKCIRTYRLIKKLVEGRFGSSVEVFLQGSYKNSTNIRKDSDIDVVVTYKGSYFPETILLDDFDMRTFQEVSMPAEYSFSQFKHDLYLLFVEEFGINYVDPGNKCITLNPDFDGNRVFADIVPTFPHELHMDPWETRGHGVALLHSETGQKIVSFPKEHYINGGVKNQQTGTKYKHTVRAIKNIKKRLLEQGSGVVPDVSSYTIECLAWNIDDYMYIGSPTSKELITYITTTIILNIHNQDHMKYMEVNGFRKLFHDTSYNLKDVENFMWQVHDFVKN